MGDGQAASGHPEANLTRTPLPSRLASEPPGRPTVQPASALAVRRTGEVLHWALPGVDLLLQPKRGVPLVSVSVFQRRAEPETVATAGLGALAVRSAVRGAGEYDATQLALACVARPSRSAFTRG